MSTTDRDTKLSTIQAFCQEHLGRTPTDEELAVWEEGMQAFCRERGLPWFRNSQPVFPDQADV
jgi:hypothetical protein